MSRRVTKKSFVSVSGRLVKTPKPVGDRLERGEGSRVGLRL
jgi:hypothetical protein